MAATDNFYAGLSGVAQGASDVLGKYIDLKFKRKQHDEDLLSQEASKRRLMGEQTDLDIRKASESPTAAFNPTTGKIEIVTGGKFAQERPQTMYQTVDAQGNVIGTPTSAKPVVIKPAQTEEEKLAARNQAKLDKEKPKALGGVRDSVKKYDSMIKEANDILNDPSLKYATGISSPLGSIPGTGAKRVAARLETLKSKTVLNTIGSLKSLSATGATGFGQLSDKEGQYLQNNITTLDKTQGTADFKNSLARFIKDAQESKNLLLDTYSNTYGEPYTPLISTPTDGSGGDSVIKATDLQIGSDFQGQGKIKAVRWKK